MFEDPYTSLTNDATLITLELWVKYTDGDTSRYGSRLNQYRTSNPYTTATGIGGYSAFLLSLEEDENEAVTTETVGALQASLNSVLTQVTALSEAQTATRSEISALRSGSSGEAGSEEQITALENQLTEQQEQNQALLQQLAELQAQLDALSNQEDGESGEEDTDTETPEAGGDPASSETSSQE